MRFVAWGPPSNTQVSVNLNYTMPANRTMPICDKAILLSVLITLFAMNPLVLAGETATNTNESAANAGEEEGERRNRISLLGGNTQDGSEHGATIGLEYERRFTKYIGLGAFVEYAGGDIDAWVISVPVFFHPVWGRVILRWAFGAVAGSYNHVHRNE